MLPRGEACRELALDALRLFPREVPGEPSARVHAADAEAPDRAAPGCDGPVQHGDGTRQPGHVVHGAAQDQGVETGEVEIGVGGSADRVAAGGTQDVGDPLGDAGGGAGGGGVGDEYPR